MQPMLNYPPPDVVTMGTDNPNQYNYFINLNGKLSPFSGRKDPPWHVRFRKAGLRLHNLR